MGLPEAKSSFISLKCFDQSQLGWLKTAAIYCGSRLKKFCITLVFEL